MGRAPLVRLWLVHHITNLNDLDASWHITPIERAFAISCGIMEVCLAKFMMPTWGSDRYFGIPSLVLIDLNGRWSLARLRDQCGIGISSARVDRVQVLLLLAWLEISTTLEICLL